MYRVTFKGSDQYASSDRMAKFLLDYCHDRYGDNDNAVAHAMDLGLQLYNAPLTLARRGKSIKITYLGESK